MKNAAERLDRAKQGANGPREAATGEVPDDLWRFVPLSDYRPPRLPVRGAVQKNWAALKQGFRRRKDKPGPFKSEEELRTLDETRLARLLAPPDWGVAAAALDTILHDWLDREAAEAGVRFIVGQPHCGLDEIVRLWSMGRAAAKIPPPEHEQVLGADARWLESFSAVGDPWVLPNLERCYLRHAQGLALVRRLLEAAESGLLGRGLIACDSWAWAYLQHVWPSTRSDALTLQAFDGAALKGLLTGLTVSAGSRTVCYRNAKSGEAILTVPSDEKEASAELVQLACHCRGNVGLALEYWRSRLRTEPEVDPSQPEARTEMEQKREAGERVVWVAPGMSGPTIPSQKDDSPMLVLHALLIHGGLPEALLAELLPLSHARCMSVLLALRGAGVVQWDEGCWRIGGLAYAAVRGVLRERDYLVDHF
jgi:hypothetical protein